MTNSPTLFFSSTSGYRFLPSLDKYEANILTLLKPSEIQPNRGTYITPLICESWIRDHKWMPSSKKIYIVGLTSHGINNIVHRGSYSAWGAARIVNKNSSFAGNAEKDIYWSIFNYMKEALENSEICSEFYNAFHSFVSSSIDSKTVLLSLDGLERIISKK